MVSPTATWPAVRVNGSRVSNSSAMPPTTCGRGMAGMAAAASRRCASAACSVNASSHLSRFLARSRSAGSSGRWMARIASARPSSPYRSLSSAGSGSSPASSVSSTVLTDLAIAQELNLALAGYTGIISAANSAASSGVRSALGGAPGSISHSG